ncbi:hypothetical protein DFA_06612 [Cavenderia fasciculata]|uniref:Non-structural maintenance of chromosomes element 4 n=1 Tax=Cavenderia fasciculata TaxID=261658 RepID=F4PJH6_CACFS|nr:uncharacterized protein DFA_06612 [Cavenderia fasciculata]EGG24462.1 hypothetical protein DFA_06612 [Cavenderia fasciculata]|eukprot:XP_004362313.1 hypothetical protein DFA_06612 [Cavenderia fasciculata]
MSKQTQQQRRQIRKDYRVLIQDTQKNKDSLVQSDSGGLLQMLEKGEQLYSQVNMPREAALDSEFLSLASQLGYEKTQRFKVAFSTFDSNGFINRLYTTLSQLGSDQDGQEEQQDDDQQDGDDDENNNNKKKRKKGRSSSTDDVQERGWKRFGANVAKQFNQTPDFDFMYGPISIEVVEKVRKQPQRRGKDEVGKLVVPEQVQDTAGANQQNETTSQRVHNMKRYLEKKKQADFIDVVTDKTSFARSVENMFYFSFLLKDGQAKLVPNQQTGALNIEAAQPPEEKDYTTGRATQRHSVVKMDYDIWKKLSQCSNQLPDFNIADGDGKKK